MAAARPVPGHGQLLVLYPDAERGPRREQREAAAKAICARCPVITECRAHALRAQERYGIWGGLTEHERTDLLTAAPR